jgi:hypothetical protein
MYLAYTDPGTGSMIAQVAMAGAAGLVVAARLGWQRTTQRWRDRSEPDTEDVAESPLAPPG